MSFPRYLLVFFAMALGGCAGVGSMSGGGISGYYANHPEGTARFRITQSMSGYEMAARDGDGWTKGRKLERLSTDDDALKRLPWLLDIIEAAYGVDGFAFIQFKQGATVGGDSLPTRYFLAPGGWAYRVAAP